LVANRNAIDFRGMKSSAERRPDEFLSLTISGLDLRYGD
jgi:hypothetical protein